MLILSPAIPPRRPQRQRRARLLPRKGPQATQSATLPPRIRRHPRHRNDHARPPTATDERGRTIEARERRPKICGLGARRAAELERGREVAEEVWEYEDQEGWELIGKQSGILCDVEGGRRWEDGVYRSGVGFDQVACCLDDIEDMI